ILYGPLPNMNSKTDIPFYYHMVPGQDFYFRGILQLLVHFRWTWVGILVKGDGGAKFQQLICSWFSLHGICIAFLEQLRTIYISNMDDGLKWFVEIFHRFINSKANVTWMTVTNVQKTNIQTRTRIHVFQKEYHSYPLRNQWE
ncbi:hypothetical protein E2320_003006, partial [Naja naja]